MNLQVLVIGENVAKQLAEYDGNREGPFVTRMDRRTVQQLYEVYRVQPGDRQGLLAALPKTLFSEATFKDDELVCRVTNNPKARWHSYTVGGCQFEFQSRTAEPARSRCLSVPPPKTDCREKGTRSVPQTG